MWSNAEHHKRENACVCHRMVCTWNTLVTNSLLLAKVKSFNINDEIKSTALYRPTSSAHICVRCIVTKYADAVHLPIIFVFHLMYRHILSLRPCAMCKCTTANCGRLASDGRNTKFTYRRFVKSMAFELTWNWKVSHAPPHTNTHKRNERIHHWKLQKEEASATNHKRINCWTWIGTKTGSAHTHTQTSVVGLGTSEAQNTKQKTNNNNYFGWPQCVCVVLCILFVCAVRAYICQSSFSLRVRLARVCLFIKYSCRQRLSCTWTFLCICVACETLLSVSLFVLCSIHLFIFSYAVPQWRRATNWSTIKLATSSSLPRSLINELAAYPSPHQL